MVAVRKDCLHANQRDRYCGGGGLPGGGARGGALSGAEDSDERGLLRGGTEVQQVLSDDARAGDGESCGRAGERDRGGVSEGTLGDLVHVPLPSADADLLADRAVREAD